MQHTPANEPWLVDGFPAAGKLARAVIRSDSDYAAVAGRAPMSLLPSSTILSCVRAAASTDPRKPALILLEKAGRDADARCYSYAELVSGIERSAALFAASSPGTPPVVSVICPLLPEALMAIWGAETVGIANPMNPFLEVEAVVTIMNTIAATVLVTGTGAYGLGAWDKLDEIIARVPSLRAVFTLGAPNDTRDFVAALADIPEQSLAAIAPRKSDEDATYMPTGGTTGAPKLVRQTQEKQLLDAWLMGALNGAASDEVVGHGMPNFHVGGLVAISLRTVLFGQTLVMLTPDGFRNPGVVREFWPILRRFAVTNIIATPTTAAALLSDRDANSAGNRLHTFSCGGSTVPTELLNAFHRRFDIYLRELWGMTEFHGVTTGHFNNGERPVVGSVGKAFPYHEVAVVNVVGGKYAGPIKAGERGILVVKGVCVGSGYFANEHATREFFVADMPDGGVWANTGDIGTVDEEGFVWVFGREKDLIVRGGHKIDPRVIEEALQHHPDVLMSAAIGQPDATRGEMPIAYVQLKSGAHASADDLIRFCADRIPERAAKPVDVIVLPKMPITGAGKIAKPTLRTDAAARVARRTASAVAGEAQVVKVEIDEKGAKRKRAIISLLAPEDKRNELDEKLRSAFLGFEFDLEVDFEDPRVTGGAA
jgi:fatty-acyl-CoA synthase